MSTLKKIQNRLLQNKDDLLLLTIILGVLFILLSWIIGFITTKTPISFSGIASVHRQTNILYLVDIFPLVVIAIVFLIELRNRAAKEEYEAEISEREREALYLKTYQDCSYRDISQIMEISEQVARNYVCGALKKLRSYVNMQSSHSNKQNINKEKIGI